MYWILIFGIQLPVRVSYRMSHGYRCAIGYPLLELVFQARYRNLTDAETRPMDQHCMQCERTIADLREGSSNRKTIFMRSVH